MRRSKPVLQNVVDLGLRDVGIGNEPRRLARHFGKAFAAGIAVMAVLLLAACAILRQLGAGSWLTIVFAAATAASPIALGLYFSKRGPATVLKVRADGANAADWLPVAMFFALALLALATGAPLMAPVLVLAAIATAVAWRARGRVPAVVRDLEAALATGERVLGDGIGAASARRRDGLRVIVCTDRRVLVATERRFAESPLVDAPYGEVRRFGVEWKYGGRLGELSLELAGGETHVIGTIAPLNLLSIAGALQSHGVPADDPEAIAVAELVRREPEPPLVDRAAMRTPEFDRGLWLFLALSAPILYLDLFGAGHGVLLLFAAACVASGYVSGTRSSVTYIVPLILLVCPAFFLMDDPRAVLVLIVLLSVVAAAGLRAGSALRAARASGVTAPSAPATAASAGRPAPGSLRQTVSGAGLIRITSMMVAATMALVVAAAVTGFDTVTVRLAIEEATSTRLPVDGGSNLTGGNAAFAYTPGPGLRELVTDEDWGAGPNDGARWELRSSFRQGHNVVSLAHYVFEPRLDDPAAVATFVAGKDAEHTRLAGRPVGHTERVVDGRTGYVWTHDNHRGYWHYAVWFPHPVHTVRVECIAKRQADRFKRLCAEALGSLEFR